MTQVYFNCKIVFNDKDVFKKVTVSNRNPLRQAIGFIRKIARQQIKFRNNPHVNSPVGSPPFTHKTRRLKDSILFALEPETSPMLQIGVVGSSAGVLDKVGKLHEFGGQQIALSRKGKRFIRTFPERPFMSPALQKSLPYLPKFWEGTLR